MDRTYEAWIPGELPSRNESELAARANKFAGASLKHKATRKVELCCLGCRQTGWVPMERYHVTVHYLCKSKRKDPDNVCGAIKFVMDGLVAAGVVAGDRWRNVLSLTQTWECNTNKPGVYLKVTGD